MKDLTAQTELDFTPRVAVDSDALDVRLEDLLRALDVRGESEGWRTARDLKQVGFGDRELRDLVEHADGRIFSYPGSPGYKLTMRATLDELKGAEALKTQAERMLRRYAKYHQIRHGRMG